MRTMRTLYIVAGALALIAIVVPAVWYFTARGARISSTIICDHLAVADHPPSNLLSLGSLYYVDSNVKFFKTICSVKKEDLKDAVVNTQHQHARGRASRRQLLDRGQT